MAAELLTTAVQQELTELDEKLYLQCLAMPQRPTRESDGKTTDGMTVNLGGQQCLPEFSR